MAFKSSTQTKFIPFLTHRHNHDTNRFIEAATGKCIQLFVIISSFTCSRYGLVYDQVLIRVGQFWSKKFLLMELSQIICLLEYSFKIVGHTCEQKIKWSFIIFTVLLYNKAEYITILYHSPYNHDIHRHMKNI